MEERDHPSLAELKAEFDDVPLPASLRTEVSSWSSRLANGPCRGPGLSKSLKRLSEGGLAGLRRQLRDLLDRGWI